MTPTPIVSVVIPAYNAEATLAETLESVLVGQDVELEVVVIDDGSTDRTAAVARGFGSVVRCETVNNAGPAAARNTGLALARAELVAFVDSDDRWLPGKLPRQVERLRRGAAVGVVTTDYRTIDVAGVAFDMPQGAVPAPPVVTGDVFEHLLLVGNFAPTLTILARKSAIEAENGFDTTLPTSEDYDLWLRLARRWRFEHVPAVLAEYRIRPGSLIRADPARTYESTRNVVRRHAELAGIQDKRVQRRLASIDLEEGYEQLVGGHHAKARHALLRSLRYAPSPLTAAYLAAALLGRPAYTAARGVRRRLWPRTEPRVQRHGSGLDAPDED